MSRRSTTREIVAVLKDLAAFGLGFWLIVDQANATRLSWPLLGLGVLLVGGPGYLKVWSGFMSGSSSESRSVESRQRLP